MNPRVFREYDIRGNADATSPTTSSPISAAPIGAYLARQGRRAASRSAATAACPRRASTRR